MMRRQPQSGFTLLEVVLALAISALVLALVGSGIRLQMRMVDREQRRVEQAELARAILRQFQRDLCSIVSPKDGAVGSGGSATGAVGPNASGVAGTNGSAGAGGSPAANSSTEDAGQSFDPSLQTGIGLYGDMTYLRFESNAASRNASVVPLGNRRENQQSMSSATGGATASGAPLDSPADLRGELCTISYFLANSNVATAGGTSIMGQSSPTGAASLSGSNHHSLMRSITDYASHTFLLENGGIDSIQQNAQEFAPEVVAIQFRYCDGIQWLDTWDSVAQGGLPVAVECTIAMAGDEEQGAGEAPPRSSRAPVAMNGLTTDATIYTTIVRLPVGQITYDVQQQY